MLLDVLILYNYIRGTTMIQIIIGIIIICFLFSIIKKILEVIGGIIVLAIGGILCFGLIVLLISNIGIVLVVAKYSLILFGILLIFGLIASIIEKLQVKKWLRQEVPAINEWQVADLINPYSQIFEDEDRNLGFKFNSLNLPYGRINSFLNFHDLGIDEEAIYYSVIRSKKDIELREYGVVITYTGIYISKQLGELDENGEYKILNKKILFKGLYKANIDKNSLEVKYIKNGKLETVKIDQSDISIPIEIIKEFCDKIIDNQISLSMYFNKVVINESLVEEVDIDILEKEFSRDKIKDIAIDIGLNQTINLEMENTKNFMNGSRGHGYGAEYANNTFDKIKGKRVINEAQNLDEHGRQVKHGADRIVNNINIQTKYYKTASESVGAAFQNKQAIYKNKNGTMMQIEVPRDQYTKACELMEKRINNGEVAGAKPGDDPRKYVRKGYFTYAQSYNVCKSGSIESLSVDALTGAIASAKLDGITIVTSFAFAIWNGADVEEAAKVGLETGIKTVGKGAIMYTVTMQLSRSEFINPFMKKYTKDGICQGFKGIKNPIFNMSESIASGIRKSAISKSQVGRSLGFDVVKGGQVIAGGVTCAIVFGPDICRALTGRISSKQLFKNASIGAAGIGGGMLGQVLIPIPFLGAIIGGGIGSFVAKTVLDEFIEDDAKEMFQILKEEFLDVVMIADLSKEEFDNILNETLCNKDLPSILRDMYASGEARNFAREGFISIAVINEISKRKKITEEMLDEGLLKLAEENIAAV